MGVHMWCARPNNDDDDDDVDARDIDHSAKALHFWCAARLAINCCARVVLSCSFFFDGVISSYMLVVSVCWMLIKCVATFRVYDIWEGDRSISHIVECVSGVGKLIAFLNVFDMFLIEDHTHTETLYMAHRGWQKVMCWGWFLCVFFFLERMLWVIWGHIVKLCDCYFKRLAFELSNLQIFEILFAMKHWWLYSSGNRK